MTTTTAKINLAQYENFLFESKEQWKAIPVFEDDEVSSYYVLFMDEEYDPVRVSIDLGGIVNMPEPLNAVHHSTYAAMSSTMLRKLADIADNIKHKHKND
jgi:hypothetical protein